MKEITILEIPAVMKQKEEEPKIEEETKEEPSNKPITKAQAKAQGSLEESKDQSLLMPAEIEEESKDG